MISVYEDLGLLSMISGRYWRIAGDDGHDLRESDRTGKPAGRGGYDPVLCFRTRETAERCAAAIEKRRSRRNGKRGTEVLS